MHYWQWTKRGFFSELSLLLYSKLNAELKNESFSCDFTKSKLGGVGLSYYLDTSVNEKRAPLLWYRSVFHKNNRIDELVDKIACVIYSKNGTFIPHNQLFDIVWSDNFEPRLINEYNFSHDKMFDFVNNHWKLSPLVEAKVDEIESTLELKTGYLSLHIRRGDKLWEEAEKKSIAHYFENISIDNYKQIFIATDDYSSVGEVKEYLKGKDIDVLSNVSECDTGHEQSKFNNQSKLEQRENIIKLLAEVEVLRKSECFVGSLSSNLGRFVYMLKYGVNSFSVDDEFSLFL